MSAKPLLIRVQPASIPFSPTPITDANVLKCIDNACYDTPNDASVRVCTADGKVYINGCYSLCATNPSDTSAAWAWGGRDFPWCSRQSVQAVSSSATPVAPTQPNTWTISLIQSPTVVSQPEAANAEDYWKETATRIQACRQAMCVGVSATKADRICLADGKVFKNRCEHGCAVNVALDWAATAIVKCPADAGPVPPVKLASSSISVGNPAVNTGALPAVALAAAPVSTGKPVVVPSGREAVPPTKQPVVQHGRPARWG